MEGKSGNLPVEVMLAEEVKSCRACPWFWEGIPPYGPYPAIDWDSPYPEAMRRKLPQTMNDTPLPWTKAKSAGSRPTEPAILRGCRKAPIMTLGINPNLSAYYASPKGAFRCYPFFSETANYAYYYRHATIFQESFAPNVIREHIISGTELVAEADGWLIAGERGTDHRWLHLTMKYVGQDEPVHYEMTWLPEERAVVLVDVTREKDINPEKPAIKKGTVCAGKLQSALGADLEVYENGSGYYQRLLPVLAECKKRLGIPETAPNLTIGEDVCMYDMVGCASPGWSSRYDIPCDRISDRCVREKEFVLRQLLQSRPAVILLVSTSSLSMFERSFSDKGGSLTFSGRNRDVYDLLKETSCRHHYFTYNRSGIMYRARVIVTPHFSYPENFIPHSRFSVEAWNGFLSEFPCDGKVLETENRVGLQTANGMIPVGIRGEEDPIRENLGYTAWQILLSRFYDPYRLIVDALLDEYSQGNLGLNGNTGHLERTAGSCAFCANSTWKFPEGCPYGKC